MQKYGKKKRGSSKLHPHNECGVCSEKKIIKNRERRKAKEEILKELKTNEYFAVKFKDGTYLGFDNPIELFRTKEEASMYCDPRFFESVVKIEVKDV